MKRGEAREVLIDTLRSINSDEQDIDVSPEDFSKAMLMAIDSLQEQVSQGLDETAENEYPLMQTDKLGNNPYISYNTQQVCRREGFKAGAKWRDAQIPKLPDNLDEAAKKYAKTQDNNFLKPEIVCQIFKSGAKWMAEQGETHEAFISVKGKRTLLSVLARLSNFKFGDKVIIQIRKKDEN